VAYAGDSSALPKAILFDIGRVIVDVDVGRAAEPLSLAAKTPPAELWRAIETDPRWPGWQEGRIPPQEWHAHLTRRFGVELGFDEFCAVWNQALLPQTILDERLFADLGAQLRLALISNTDPIHVAHMEKNYSFMRHFPAASRIYSCAVGASKPSPEIFAQGIAACGVSAGEILYVDDVPEYVQAGQHMGMKTIRFVGAEELLRKLSDLGFLFGNDERTNGA